MTIHYELDGPVAVVTIDRPEVANAIDRPTADALADAFRRFDADDDASVAVLTGANGTFCAGADLKAMREPDASRVTRVEPDGDGPVGPTRMLLAQAGDRRGRGPRRGRRARAGGVVRPARGRGRRRVRRLLPALGHPAHGRRHDPPARLIGHSHALDLILTGRGVSGEEALRMGLANRLTEPGAGAARRRWRWRTRWPHGRRPRSAATGSRPTSSGRSRSRKRSPASTGTGWTRSRTGELGGGLESYESGAWREDR